MVLVVNHCFETWLLGRVDLYPKEPVDEGSFFYPYYSYYNVERKDPEDMSVPEELDDSIATYHYHYLHDMLRYKKIRYCKSRPRNVGTIDYFNGLLQRINDTVHLQSFREFYDFIQNEKTNL